MCHASSRLPAFALLLSALALVPLRASAWRSALYPADWRPPGLEASFETDKLIQDFSYAGYQAGESPVPEVTGPVFNAAQAPYNADPTGTADSTLALQSAINAAKAAGGGVVYLPAGLYRVSPQGSASYALRIDASNIILRGAGAGQTFLLNTSTNMRNAVVILVEGSTGAGFFAGGAGTTPIRQDLPGPTRVLPVGSTAGFAVGQWVMVRADASDAWVSEHNEPGWIGYSNSLRGVAYFRRVVAVNAATNSLTLDTPTRYYLKTRDNARVIRLAAGPVTEVGLEDFSIGNVQNPGTGWREEDYNYPTNAAYYVHNSFLVKMLRARDSWMRRVETFQPAGNTTTCHLLSNGVLLQESSRLTLSECHFQRPQYGGGGGNGYMYRLQNANDCLLQACRATFSRHGMVLSHMGSCGNVFHQCIDKDTGRQTGDTGSQTTGGSNSDHHMHFSHSNLIDASTGDNSSWEARYRPYGTPPLHNVTAAHGVYWNLLGTGGGPAYVIRTEQSRYGYAIGTRGTRTGVDRPTFGGAKCNPADHVEGVGQGDTLEPFSLYQDQLARRLGLPAVTLPATVTLPFPENSTRLAATVLVGGMPATPGSFTAQWRVVATTGQVFLSAPNASDTQATFDGRGTHWLELAITAGGHSATAQVAVVLAPPLALESETVVPEADAFVRDGPYATNNYGAETTLHLKKSSAGYNRRGFVRFNLAAVSLTNFNRAWLELRSPAPPTPGIEPGMEFRLVTNDTWLEMELTWANQPAMGSPIQSWLMNTGGVERVEVTAAALGEFAGDKRLSGVIQVTSQPGDNVYYYHAREAAAGQGPRLVLEKITAPVTFADWMAGYDTIPEPLRGPTDDPDGDGFKNLEELFFAQNPAAPEVGPALRWTRSGGILAFRYRQRKGLPLNFHYLFESAPALTAAEWQPVPGMVFTRLADSPDAEEWEAWVPEAFSASSRFYRLKLALSP